MTACQGLPACRSQQSTRCDADRGDAGGQLRRLVGLLPVRTFCAKRFEERFRPGHVSLGWIGLDEYVRATVEDPAPATPGDPITTTVRMRSRSAAVSSSQIRLAS